MMPTQPLLAGARAAWTDLIRSRCGLALRDPQVPALAEAVQSRMQALGVPSPDRYFDLVEAENDTGREWTELIERLVNHETSFFRHAESYEALRTRVLPDLRRRPDYGAGQLHLCSAGCSTGEEAYSIAMVAMADPMVPGDFTVWGVDISRRAIDTARAGRYSARAVAGVPANYRRFVSPCVDVAGGAWEISRELRDRVRFLTGNLFETCGVFVNYDLIVCQNVLIYFAPAAVPRVIATLAARLTPGGYLLLGPGEAPIECPPGLEVLNLNGVRVFRRTGRTAKEVRA